MKNLRHLFFCIALASPIALAANYPCSGKKGGVSHCEGPLFICNDGSASGSKKNCSAMYGSDTKPKKKTKGNK